MYTTMKNSYFPSSVADDQAPNLSMYCIRHRACKTYGRQVLDKRASQELQAFVHDAYGLYFLRRGKSSAALDYVQKAMKTHARMRVRSAGPR